MEVANQGGGEVVEEVSVAFIWGLSWGNLKNTIKLHRCQTTKDSNDQLSAVAKWS